MPHMRFPYIGILAGIIKLVYKASFILIVFEYDAMLSASCRHVAHAIYRFTAD